MNNSIYRFSLDVHETSSQVLIELKQNDTAREFQISLTENGRPYIIEEDCYAVFTATKPDGNIINNECTIEDNTIFYTTTPQSTCIVGEVLCEIKLYGAGDEQHAKALTSPSFTVLVNAAVYQDGDVIEESNSEYGALGSLYLKTNALNKQLTEKLENGEFQGKDGKSAYEIAVDNGFEGTEEEWLESLKGSGNNSLINENHIEKVEKLPTTPKNELVALVKDEVFDWNNVEYTESLEAIKGIYNVRFSTIPETIDLTPIKDKIMFSAIVFYNLTTNQQVVLATNGKYILVDFNQSSNSLYYYEAGFVNENNFEAPESGWYKGDTTFEKATESDLKILNGIYTNIAVVDYGKLTEGGSSVKDSSIDYIINLLAKEIVVPINKGFYVAENEKWLSFIPTSDFATKQDLGDIEEKLNALVPKSWADVQQLVRSGQASRVFSVGDQLVCSKNGTAHVWDIIGIDYDTPLNPNYKHSITLQLNTAVETKAFDDDSHDYSTSTVRAYLNGDYLNGFDADFLSVLGGIRKSDLSYNTDAESEEDDIYPESDVFFLLSDEEVFTNPYEFYSSAEADPTIRIKSAGNALLSHWWLRSKSQAGTVVTAADKVGTNGSIGLGTITKASYYLAPACVIY